MMEQIFHFAKFRLKAASGTIVIGVSGIGFSGSCHTSARSAARSAVRVVFGAPLLPWLAHL